MTVLLFPGQGSQVKGMGEGLFEAMPKMTAKADEVLGYSIKTLCLEDPENKLNQTEFTQPALYVTSAMAFCKYRDTNPQANFLMGHSVGEYAALFAAECFDFVTGLQLVKKRGELMRQVIGGAMTAILKLSPEQIQQCFADNAITTIDIANLNTPEQTVISGLASDMPEANAALKAAGGKCIPLTVSGAFHSRYMEEAKQAFADHIKDVSFQPCTTPVIANVTASRYRAGDLPELLIRQITESVRWVDSVHYATNHGESDFVEINPGKPVLKGLVNKIVSA